MQENNSQPHTEPRPKNFFARNQTTFKGFIIGILLFMLLIPKSMVSDLIYERENYRQEAINEVSSKWGNRQTLTGPFVSIPYIEFYRDAPDQEFKKIIKFAHFLPEELKINGELFPEKRYRSIYEVVVYNSKVHFEGYFDRFNVASLGVPKENILWEYASICIGIDDLRGVEEQISLQWNENKIFFNPGLEHRDIVNNGVFTKVPIKNYTDTSVNRYKFDFTVQIKGSEQLYFTPLGKETTVQAKSNWNTPRFDGAFLPDEREVTESGFSARWKVLHLNRNFPQFWLGNMNVYDSSFGITLKIPIDNYKQAHRSVKYAFMLLTLTFALFFFIEMLNKRMIHPFHYILIGLGLCLFFTLLVSISEHILFGLSYLIATIMTVGLITWYAYSILNDSKLAKLISGTLLILYGYIYLIVRLEDFALLVGSFGLFASLAIVMYFARKVDWYDIDGQ